jgi:ribosome-binding factor A
MRTQRQQRVAHLLREEISSILRRQLKDPRLGLVSITEVEVAPDLREAQVYVSALGDGPARAEALRVLRGAAGFVQGELGRNIRLRHIPRLDFRQDAALERGNRVLDLLDEIAKEEDAEGPQREGGGAQSPGG